MSAFLEHLLQRAAKLGKTIALAEGNDPRVAKAAEILTRDKICKVVLVGDEKKIRESSPDFKFDGVRFWNPAEGKHVEKYAQKLYELRKEKGMTEEVALRTIKGNNMFYACTALKCGDVDGVVGKGPEEHAFAELQYLNRAGRARIEFAYIFHRSVLLLC